MRPAVTLVALSLLASACASPPVAPAISAQPPPEARALAPLKRSSGLQVVFDLSKTEIRVVIGEPALALRPMRGRTFVTVQDVLFYVDGDTLRSDPELQRGLSDTPRPNGMLTELGAMGGHWPDAAWLQVNHIATRAYSASFLRWTGHEWAEGPKVHDGIATTVVPLQNAWSLVISQSPWSSVPWATDPPWPVSMLHPRWAVPIVRLGEADSVATLADGTLFTASNGTIKRWSPEGEPLPMPTPAYTAHLEVPVASQLVAVSSSALFMLNVLNTGAAERLDPKPEPPQRPGSQLLRFDGARWGVERTPSPSPSRIFAGPRGALWVAQGDALYERAADGVWSSLEAPASLENVWVASDDDVWATSGPLLLHTRPLPAGVDLAKLVPPYELMRYSRDCPSLTALLDEVPRTAPATHDFRDQLDAITPRLGKLLPSFAFYDATVAGKRTIVAHLPAPTEGESRDWNDARRIGDQLVADARSRGAKRPRLVCVEKPDDLDDARLLSGAAPPPTPLAQKRTRASLDACQTPLVVLFAPGSAAPKDFDFPLTRRALKGHTELATVRFFDMKREGKRTIVASTRDKKEALALIAIVKRDVRGSAPALVCEPTPSGAREVRVDLATGDVKR